MTVPDNSSSICVLESVVTVTMMIPELETGELNAPVVESVRTVAMGVVPAAPFFAIRCWVG